MTKKDKPDRAITIFFRCTSLLVTTVAIFFLWMSCGDSKEFDLFQTFSKAIHEKETLSKVETANSLERQLASLISSSDLSCETLPSCPNQFENCQSYFPKCVQYVPKNGAGQVNAGDKKLAPCELTLHCAVGGSVFFVNSYRNKLEDKKET
jgi:hypothetical protein